MEYKIENDRVLLTPTFDGGGFFVGDKIGAYYTDAIELLGGPVEALTSCQKHPLKGILRPTVEGVYETEREIKTTFESRNTTIMLGDGTSFQEFAPVPVKEDLCGGLYRAATRL